MVHHPREALNLFKVTNKYKIKLATTLAFKLSKYFAARRCRSRKLRCQLKSICLVEIKAVHGVQQTMTRKTKKTITILSQSNTQRGVSMVTMEQFLGALAKLLESRTYEQHHDKAQ